MRRQLRVPASAIACLLLANVLGAQERRIGRIAFFGYDGVDVIAIRDSLPFREGDIVPVGDSEADASNPAVRWKESIGQAVNRVLGRFPTDVASPCCDEAGQVLIYIGLPGKSVRPVRYNQAPKEKLILPDGLLQLHMQVDDLLFKAILEGRAAEDRSEGYSLAKDEPALRSKQLEFRDEVRKNEAEILKVVRSSADAGQRGIAATALGYARQTEQQISALVTASFDPDDGVRNNAARALAVLLFAKPESSRRIPARRFIDLLSSGTWSDRNKGLMVVQALTETRDSSVLRDLRSRTLVPLIEMAQWPKGHAISARLILGRAAGIDEQRLAQVVDEEPPNTLLQAFRKQRAPF